MRLGGYIVGGGIRVCHILFFLELGGLEMKPEGLNVYFMILR